ncbi:hypothetical protein [Andreprevotia chitinilytica]|uniref:hypothetical protein n=1 Tax=Andreprevotia chitinilytica TaxID=396808 RepID=UPI0012EB1267|nr:hypothetical protein [Andreprevotia chitinilytica]
MTDAVDIDITAAKKRVFDFVDSFHAAIAAQNIQQIEQVTGALILNKRNKYWRNFVFEVIRLPGSVTISPGRIASNGNRIEIFGYFNISGVCITREEVWLRYGRLPVIETPRPNAPDSEIVYVASFETSKLTFGFAQQSPNCLGSVGAAILNPPPYPFGKPD